MNNTMDSRLRGNVFCASNPVRLTDALWTFLRGRDFANDIIFLPSRRAVRGVEKMIVENAGTAVILPKLIALGEDADEADNTERLIILAKSLSNDPNIRGFPNAIELASELIKLSDRLDEFDIRVEDWSELVDEKYAKHFGDKAQILNIVTGLNTDTRIKNRDKNIRGWIGNLGGFDRVIIACPNLTVPSVADLAEHVAGLLNGAVLLQGLVPDYEMVPTNPYYPARKFLGNSEIKIIDTGKSDIEFFNSAFSNNSCHLSPVSCHRIDCPRESIEADCVAEICARAMDENKTVLVITPDAAGNQRIAQSLHKRGLSADFSGGISGNMTGTGRAILNKFDEVIEIGNRRSEIRNLFDFIESFGLEFSDEDAPIIIAIDEVSKILTRYEIILGVSDARAIIANTLARVSIRPPLNEDTKIRVLGVIESRMQNADVIILTGLNEGMFPGAGYSNPWIPRGVAEKIGLPSPNTEVSLTALDFITLSCGREVYWLRSKTAGSSVTTESRFLSRVDVMTKSEKRKAKSEILESVLNQDNIAHKPMDYSSPAPPADRGDVYVTDLELLIHNPYAYYAKHILRLRPKRDYWETPDARDFGNLIHAAIEDGAVSISDLDKRAREILEPGSVLFHLWHKRFLEIIPAVQKLLEIKNSHKEIELQTVITGRRVRARADMVYDDVVVDIKTGAAPNRAQLVAGNMPQLPIEAYMRGARVMQFLQLKNNDVRMVEYSGDVAKQMIDATVQKVSELFGRYSKDFEPYEYYETSDAKYKAWDDLARISD